MNSEYIEQAQTCLVKTCSECCMTEIEGKFNIKGFLHRQEYRITNPDRILPDGTIVYGSSWRNCRACPVHLESVKSGEFDRVLREIDGTP